MGDLDRATQASMPVSITNQDETKQVDIVTVQGQNRLATDSNISSINVPLGKDPLPDTFFTILTAGAIGDQVDIFLQGTFNDSTATDVDLPPYNYVYTLVAEDVGNERQLSINIADALNADPLFEAQFLEAQAIGDDGDDNQRAIVYITSTKFSLNGEFYERPNDDDFDVTTTGTTTVQFFSSAYNKLVSRPKEVSLARDPRNPHRLGVQSISGSVFIRSNDPDKLIREYMSEVGNPSNTQMATNASVANPDIFEFVANPDGGADKIIDSLKFIVSDGNIKVQSGTFLGINSPLDDPILVQLIRDGIVIFESQIFNTLDILGGFSTTASDNKIINQSGGDYLESTFSLIDSNLAFVLRNGKDDRVRVTIQDNISSVDSMRMLITGSED